MCETMGGRMTPPVNRKLMIHHNARYIARYPAEVWLFKYQDMPKVLLIFTDSDWTGDAETQENVSCAVETFGAHMLECYVGKQGIVVLSSTESESYGIVRGTMGMQTLQVLEASVRALSVTEAMDDDENLVKLKVDTSMNWSDFGMKTHPKDWLDSLMSQLPLRHTIVGAITAGSMAVASAEDPLALPGTSWTVTPGGTNLVTCLTAGEMMVIVVLVLVLAATYLALCCWSHT